MRLAKSDEHLPVNIGNPNEFTILECAQRVLEVTGSKSKIRYEPLPQDDPKQRRPDITKARSCWDGNRRLIWRPGLRDVAGLFQESCGGGSPHRATSYSPVCAVAATKSINCCTPARSSLVFSLNETPIP